MILISSCPLTLFAAALVMMLHISKPGCGATATHYLLMSKGRSRCTCPSLISRPKHLPVELFIRSVSKLTGGVQIFKIINLWTNETLPEFQAWLVSDGVSNCLERLGT